MPFHNFQKEPWVCFSFIIHDLLKKNKKKGSGERSYPDSNRGNQKFFDISSL